MNEYIIKKEYWKILDIPEYKELIRCKDCKYYDDTPTYKDGFCDKLEMCVYSNWFCADGERKSE